MTTTITMTTMTTITLPQDKEVEEAIVRKADMLQTTTKVAGLQLMTQIMDGILENVTNELLESGVWADPLQVAVSADVAALLQKSIHVLESYSAAEEVVNELLFIAQERYTEMEAFQPRPRRMELTILFQSENDGAEGGMGTVEMEVVVEGENETEEREGGKGSEGKDVGSADSSDSAGASRKPSPLAENPNKIGPILVDEFDTIASVEVKIIAELRRKKLLDKKFKLYSYVVAALKGREFPLDACLLNFELPSTLNIIV